MSLRSVSGTLYDWLNCPTEEVARRVSGQPEPVVMGWPYNGTRRWYAGYRKSNPDAGDYLTVLIRRQAEHHRMVFDHGVSVLLAPSFGAETLKRGDSYTRYALGGLLQLAEDEVYRQMFDSGVRIRFYGDYEEALSDSHYRPVLKELEDLTRTTAAGDGPLLMIGLFADDHYPKVARISVEFAGRVGRPPDRRELVEAYYGVPVPDLSLYVGFAQPEMFDVPLITTGLEHLYVTLAPSPTFTERQLREILYDHLFARRHTAVDYDDLSPEAERELSTYSEAHVGKTFGVGRVDPASGMWRPVLPGTEDTPCSVDDGREA